MYDPWQTNVSRMLTRLRREKRRVSSQEHVHLQQQRERHRLEEQLHRPEVGEGVGDVLDFILELLKAGEDGRR